MFTSYRVAAITTVAGNVPLQQTTRNALTVTAWCDADVPVYAGLGKPLLRTPSDATFFHGQAGMGDLNLPLPRRQPMPEHAVDALVRVIEEHAENLTLVTLGPLSNIAAAVLKAPRWLRYCATLENQRLNSYGVSSTGFCSTRKGASVGANRCVRPVREDRHTSLPLHVPHMVVKFH